MSVTCEQCGLSCDGLYSLFPAGKAFPYLDVCENCVSDIGSWVDRCGYFDGADVADGGDEILWSRVGGQLFNPRIETTTENEL